MKMYVKEQLNMLDAHMMAIYTTVQWTLYYKERLLKLMELYNDTTRIRCWGHNYVVDAHHLKYQLEKYRGEKSWQMAILDISERYNACARYNDKPEIIFHKGYKVDGDIQGGDIRVGGTVLGDIHSNGQVMQFLIQIEYWEILLNL